MDIKERHIGELIPADYNPRQLSDSQFEQIKTSIEKFGFVDPIIVNKHPDRDDVIVGGHQRVKVAQSMGIDKVPTVEVELDIERERELNVRLNKASGEWDFDVLANEFDIEDLIDWGFDEDELTGFDVDDIEPEEVDATEPPEKAITELGRIYQLGRHRLMCGDSTSEDDVGRLMGGDSADFCFTSPPYNGNTSVGFKQGQKGGMDTTDLYQDNESDNRTSEDYLEFNNRIIRLAVECASDDFTLCYNINYNKNSPSEYIDVVSNAKTFIPLVETIVWEKSMAISLQGSNLTRITEFVFVFSQGELVMNKGQTECVKNLWKVSNIGANTDTHKACFPVELVSKGIELFCKLDGVVYEPFGGSGTTLIACEQLNRSCRMMELDPRYCDVIVRRYAECVGADADEIFKTGLHDAK